VNKQEEVMETTMKDRIGHAIAAAIVIALLAGSWIAYTGYTSFVKQAEHDIAMSVVQFFSGTIGF